MSVPITPVPFRVAIFRLRDVCVRVQEGMREHLKTASLDPRFQIEPTFRWLRRQGVDISLLSDYDAEQTELLLTRLGWSVGPEGTVQSVVLEQEKQENPVARALDVHGLRREEAHQALAVVDTPRLLELAHRAGVGLRLGVTNGSHSYATLQAMPHSALLDSTLQLVNYLLQLTPADELSAPARRLTFAWPRVLRGGADGLVAGQG